MVTKKQPTTYDGTTSKGKSIGTAGGIVSPSDLYVNPIVEETVFAPSQGATEDIHPPSTHKTQLLQMFIDMREEMAK